MVAWSGGSAYSTSAESLQFASAAVAYVDDGYSNDRRTPLEPPVVCEKVARLD